tara:strand:+ start:19223 stop:19447 length:225 start_codon:yes stop_codon:yes gene_type:complete
MKLLPPPELIARLAEFGDFSVKRDSNGIYRGCIAKDGQFMNARDKSLRVCLHLMVTGWEETEEKHDEKVDNSQS